MESEILAKEQIDVMGTLTNNCKLKGFVNSEVSQNIKSCILISYLDY